MRTAILKDDNAMLQNSEHIANKWKDNACTD